MNVPTGVQPQRYARPMSIDSRVLPVPAPDGTIRQVRVSSPERVIWKDADITKWDLAMYVVAVEDGLMRAIADRPVTLQRFPEGVAGEEFFSKNPPRGVPKWARSVICTYPSGPAVTPSWSSTRLPPPSGRYR